MKGNLIFQWKIIIMFSLRFGYFKNIYQEDIITIMVNKNESIRNNTFTSQNNINNKDFAIPLLLSIAYAASTGVPDACPSHRHRQRGSRAMRSIGRTCEHLSPRRPRLSSKPPCASSTFFRKAMFRPKMASGGAKGIWSKRDADMSLPLSLLLSLSLSLSPKVS